MCKLLTFLIALVTIVFGVHAATAQMSLTGAGGTKRASAPSKSYTFAGSDFNTGGVGNTWTTTAANIGAAAAGRLVIVMLGIQNNPAITVTVNGVSMTQAVVDTSGNQASIWYGTVPTGSGAATIIVTGGNFLVEAMMAYYATGLSANTPVNTAHGNQSATLGVNAGDFLFGFSSAGAAPSYSGSTQTPSGTQTQTGCSCGQEGFSADWTIASTNASFLVSTTQSGGNSTVAANWR